MVAWNGNVKSRQGLQLVLSPLNQFASEFGGVTSRWSL